MTNVQDVPADKLIDMMAEKLKTNEKIVAPEWAGHVKTGIHREKAPTEKDWWYRRVAAVMRKVYIYGPIGTEQLSAKFGGPRDRGSKPNRSRSGSRAIIRLSLKQLESCGYLTPYKKLGRSIAPPGQKFMDAAAREVMAELVKTRPEMNKYA
ncbi:MAG: 30S ribosomal protein S19e [Methanobacteriota archaeon]